MKTAFLFLILLSLFLSMPGWADSNSTDYRIINEIIDMGGERLSSGGSDLTASGYKMDTSITDVAGIAKFKNTLACVGFLCISLEQIREQNFVTFILSVNISGKAGDIAYVDDKGEGFYLPLELNKMFACVEDPSIQNTPTFGIVFAGRQLNYIQLQNSTNTSDMRLSQYEEGNSFILPVTVGGCSAIRSKLPISSLASFVPSGNLANAIEIFLSYPFMDIVGNFQRTGPTSLVLEKNNTNQIVIEVV